MLHGLLRATPLHPQWLLGKRRVPAELAQCRGVVVDVGSADRWLESRLRCARYVALDRPWRDSVSYGTRPDVFCDAAALPLATASVDAVACFEVLEHLTLPTIAIEEAFRVLRPGGIYAVSAPFAYPLHDRPCDYRRYTPHGLERDLQSAGFEVIAIRPMLGALEAAGLLAALALAGGIAAGGWRWILAPLAAVGVLAINLVSRLLGRLWPRWDGLAMGFEAVARRP